MSAIDLAPVAALHDLSVTYRSGTELVHAVRGVSLSIGRGETVGIVGESGSGKSTIAAVLAGLLAANACVTGGRIAVAGRDMTGASDARWRTLQGRVVGLVPQDPMVSLNPTMRIGRQIGEAVARARDLRRRAADVAVVELLEQVGLDRPVLRARQYPHELSGGMRQRVLIAIALAGRPSLVIADEPTSGLDVTVQKRVLDHLETLVRQQGISLLIITHDPGVASDRADRILVLREGRVVEQGSPDAVLRAARRATTRALIAAAPALPGHGAFAAGERHSASGAPEILRLERVSKTFTPSGSAWFGRRADRLVQALDDVSFSARAGRTLAIVGESGSGKTTALRIALGLIRPDSGRVMFEDRDLTQLDWAAFRPLRRRLQLVQQNPYAALDPRYTVFESIVEPLRAFDVARGEALVARARQLVDQVRLPGAVLNRLPRELSGGQRQRVAIARALALSPALLFLDEPVSALDVSVQAQVLDLLGELQRELGVSYVLVSHDLAVVAAIADEIVVVNRGRVVEQGGTADVFARPATAFTRDLIAAIPGRRHEQGTGSAAGPLANRPRAVVRAAP
jgi:peptide/nickel transport system ATP-binding protein